MESQGCWNCIAVTFLHICHICVYPSQLQQRLSISYLPSRTQPSCTFLLSTLHNTQTSHKDLEISDIIFHQQKNKQNTHKLKLSSLSHLYPPPFTYLPSKSPPFFLAHTPKKKGKHTKFWNLFEYHRLSINKNLNFSFAPFATPKKTHTTKNHRVEKFIITPLTSPSSNSVRSLPWLQHPNSCSAG